MSPGRPCSPAVPTLNCATAHPAAVIPIPSRNPRYWNADRALEDDLRARGELQALVDLVARHSWWVRPGLARRVGCVYPATARIPPGRYDLQGKVVGGVRLWTNQPAQDAFFRAVGSKPRFFSGYTVCHVYPTSARLPDHFTRLSNLFVVPRPLAGFTEWGGVLAAVKRHAYELHGYRGPWGGAPPPRARAAFPSPVLLPPARQADVVRQLLAIKALRPKYQRPRLPMRGREHDLGVRKSPRARRLDEEFWAEIRGGPSLRLLTGAVARHALMAPPAVVRACPNPRPLTRRAKPSERLPKGTLVVGGVAICDNTPAYRAIVAAVGKPVTRVRGAQANHLYGGAPFLPKHNCHLAGLALVPLAMATLVDSAPIASMLKRRSFERTGYRGPAGRNPPRAPWAPRPWPEGPAPNAATQARSVALLLKWKAHRPAFYPPRSPAAPLEAA